MNELFMNEIAAKFACETYAYHGQLGLTRHDLDYCKVVQDRVNPNVWSSNKAYAVAASTDDEIELLMREVDEVSSTLPYRHFVVDPYTPPAFVAYLALNDYVEQATIIQMVLNGPIKMADASSVLRMRPVSTGADWTILRELVQTDYAEGGRTQGKILSTAVTDGIVASYQAKKDECQFFIAELDAQPCAYGSGLCGPNAMGMVEDLFTLPQFRKRGIASAVIAHCVNYCRSRGATQVLIGSHANEPPKHLYRRLGFEPVCLTRDYIKHL